jgi:hypothetical protein
VVGCSGGLWLPGTALRERRYRAGCITPRLRRGRFLRV